MHRVLKRNGHALLYLPADPVAARETLCLYPAQRPIARLVRTALACWSHTRLPMPLSTAEPPSIPWSAIAWNDGPQVVDPARVGVLAGNPGSPGRRFVYLLFDERQRTLGILKAGFDDRARAKIRAERSFLVQHGDGERHIPVVLGSLEAADLEGVVLPFYRGATPRDARLGSVLEKWIQPGPRVALGALTAWSKLGDESVRDAVALYEVQPVLAHGDFAPWNVIVDANGVWRVVDWERGDPAGVPAWDWFHFIIQTALLVDRSSLDELRTKVSTLIASPSFTNYAERTGIAGIEEAILKGYLHHMSTLLMEQPNAKAEQVARTLNDLADL